MTGSRRKMPKMAVIVGALPVMPRPELRRPAVITLNRIVPGGDI